MKSVEDYRQGFLDGMRADHKCPQTLMIMGYTFDQILKLILKDKELTKEEKDREKFREVLDSLGHPEATCYSHWALEAYDKVHCPKLRK